MKPLFWAQGLILQSKQTRKNINLDFHWYLEESIFLFSRNLDEELVAGWNFGSFKNVTAIRSSDIPLYFQLLKSLLHKDHKFEAWASWWTPVSKQNGTNGWGYKCGGRYPPLGSILGTAKKKRVWSVLFHQIFIRYIEQSNKYYG